MDVEGGSSSAMEEADEQSCSDTAESGQPRAKLMRANSDENTSKTMIKNEKGKPSREDEHLIEKPLSACSSPSIGPISGSATLVADGVPRSCPMLADHTTPAAPKSPVAAGSYATQTQASDQQEFKPEPSENSLAADVSLATSTQGNNHTEMRTDPTSGDAPPSVPTEQPVQEPLQEGVGLQQNEAGSSSVPGSSLARVALAYRTDESNCETSDASEDSDDSADIEASSSSEGGPGVTRRIRHATKNKKKVEPEEPVEDVRTKGELGMDDLPPIEELQITVDDNVVLHPLGKIVSTVGVLVVIQAERSLPALDMDTILFLDGKVPLGQVFETFGPVAAPLYSVRFNSTADIRKRGIKVGMEVFYAPEMETFTKYVFMEKLRMQGSDASWEHNNEPPEKHLAYSDDEQERKANQRRKNKNNPEGGEDDSFAEGPLRRRGVEDDGMEEDGTTDTPGKKKKKRKPMKKKPMNGYTADISESSDGFQSTGTDGQSVSSNIRGYCPGGRHAMWQWSSGESHGSPQWPPSSSNPRWRAPPPPNSTRSWLQSPRLSSHRQRPTHRGGPHSSWQSRESRHPPSRDLPAMDNRWQGHFNNNQAPNSAFSNLPGPPHPSVHMAPPRLGGLPSSGPHVEPPYPGQADMNYDMSPLHRPPSFPPPLPMDNMSVNMNHPPLMDSQFSQNQNTLPPFPPRPQFGSAPHFGGNPHFATGPQQNFPDAGSGGWSDRGWQDRAWQDSPNEF